MRREILKKVTASITCSCDYSELAAETDGFSGADLRLMVKEAMLSALMDRREAIDRNDIERGIIMVKNRDAIQRMNWL
jgi:ATP-dependent 26S proteasome regulatory subunit